MKSLSSAGVPLAIVAAAVIGLASTWLLMRQPAAALPPVALGEAPEDSSRASDGIQRVSVSADSPRQTVRTVTSAPARAAVADPAAAERSEIPPPPVPSDAIAPAAQSSIQLAINERASPETPRRNSVGGNSIDDALSFALEAALPYEREGFAVRQDYWGGDLAVKSTKAIVHQLFKGNEYWFWAGTATKNAVLSVHIYDSNGKLAEAEAWSKPRFAAARVVPKKSGSYYLIVEVEKSDRERTTWALAYGFK